MAENDENGLIGYDPLAWMEQGQSKNPETVQTQSNADNEKSAEQSIAVDETVEPPESLQHESSSEENSMHLDSVLNIQHVGKLHEDLLKMLELSNKIEIDASAVSSVDTASLQLLLVFKQTALKNGKELIIDFPSEKFIEAAELLGVSEMLGIDESPAGFF